MNSFDVLIKMMTPIEARFRVGDLVRIRYDAYTGYESERILSIMGRIARVMSISPWFTGVPRTTNEALDFRSYTIQVLESDFVVENCNAYQLELANGLDFVFQVIE